RPRSRPYAPAHHPPLPSGRSLRDRRTFSKGGRMSRVRLATAPVSWGIWEQTIDRPDLVPPKPLLETVTSMGYRALETGPPGYLAENGAGARRVIEPFDVELVAT